MEVVHKIPFLRLLLPLLIGIILQYYIDIYRWSIIPIGLGLGIMLLSCFIKVKYQYYYRYLFGLGLSLGVIGIGLVSTYFRQELSHFTFPDISQVYEGVIIDLPQEKPYTINLKVELTDSYKQVVCYLPKNKLSKDLRAGDRISFFAKILKFENKCSSDNFDYASFMNNKGYAGVAFVKSPEWQKVNGATMNFNAWSSRCRQSIFDYYRTLQLSDTELGILSALTLGYTDPLSDDLVDSFRSAGVAHLLAISGMHMIVFYSVILGISGLFLRRVSFQSSRYLLIILVLWIYVFVIGFPPSAVRACILLTILCVSKIKGIDGYSLNSFFACAFLMLVWNPLWLFDIGFQLSFTAVFSMILLLPLFSTFLRKGNTLTRYFKTIAVVSIVVQIATLPICLYYFGVFPSYFFIANLLIIPLFTISLYIALCIVVISIPVLLFPSASGFLYYIPIEAFKFVVKVLTDICRFLEHLPFALLSDLKIGLPSIFLIWLMTFSFTFFLKNNKPRLLICGLSVLLTLIGLNIYNLWSLKNSLSVSYSYEEPKVEYYVEYRKISLKDFSSNKIINLNGSLYFILVENKWQNIEAPQNRKDIDFLHIVQQEGASMYSISRIFNIKKVILDGILSDYDSKRLALECEKLRIPCHQLSDDGALRIFF